MFLIKTSQRHFRTEISIKILLFSKRFKTCKTAMHILQFHYGLEFPRAFLLLTASKINHCLLHIQASRFMQFSCRWVNKNFVCLHGKLLLIQPSRPLLYPAAVAIRLDLCCCKSYESKVFKETRDKSGDQRRNKPRGTGYATC